MKTKWLQIALKNGGELSCWMQDGKFIARVTWRENGKQVQSEPENTLQGCLISLNNALWDDANDECGL
jgi:hypothetical protein